MNKPWPEIVLRYEQYSGDDAAIKAMLVLCQHVANCGLAKGLFAWTSMFDLCITQTEVTYPYDGPYLRVSPLPDGQIEFRYFDTRETINQWHRTVAALDAVPRLHKFLEQLHWFPTQSLQP
jgi:hypothetical protein